MSHQHDHAHSWAQHAVPFSATMELIEPQMKPVTDALLDAARAAPGVRLLDLACGPGHTTAAAHARGADALGIDITPSMIEAARRRFPLVRFQVGDMLDPPPGPWDAIVSRFAAHHVDNAWIEAARDRLAPGGRIAVAELGPTDEPSRANGMMPPEAWADLFTRAGLVDAEITTLPPRRASSLMPTHFTKGPAHIIRARRA